MTAVQQTPPPTVEGLEQLTLVCAECRLRSPSDGTVHGMCPACGGELYVPGKCLAAPRGEGTRGMTRAVYCLRPSGHSGPHRAVREWV